MKLVKIFGIVMAFHAAAFMFIFAIPGCRSTNKKPAATAPVIGSEPSPVAAAESAPPPASSEVSAVRFSPTRPGTPAAAEVAAPQAQASTYAVAKGDNLWSIAKKSGVTVKQLAAANKISTDTPLKLGQKLTIPAKATPPAAAPAAPATHAAPAAPAAKAQAITHVVKPGETLGSIAKKYQVKVGEIATANNIADPTKVRVGQSLKIPGWQAPAAKPAAHAPASALAPAPAPAPEPAHAAPAPQSPVFGSPIESAPPANGSPFITPAPESEAPVIRVEDSGAPKID